MIVDRPAIDWLTLTTFSYKQSGALFEWVQKNTSGETKESSWKQYRGTQGEGFFYGSASQNGKDHYMLRLSGDLSDRFMFDPLRPSADCNRLDLQVTVAWPYTKEETYEQFKAFTDTMEAVPVPGQRKRKVNTIISPDGFCTAYVGSRESERFYRIYVKEDDQLYLRFEAEFKGKKGVAGMVYRRIGKEATAAVGIEKAELDTLPDHTLTAPFKELLRGVPADVMKGGRVRSDPHKTLRWIKRQVMPAFKRVLAYDDTRDTAVFMLDDLFQFTNNLDLNQPSGV